MTPIKNSIGNTIRHILKIEIRLQPEDQKALKIII